MSSKPRPTQSDVAREAGVSRPTVSLALKGSPVVSEETRNHVRKIAESLGYVPDPMLSALAKYRNSETNKSYQGTLAWVSASPSDLPWYSIIPYSEYFRGASEQAARMGYKIECIDLLQERISAERLEGILEARGISGILACPPNEFGEQIDIPWEKYHVITFGYSISEPHIHRVSPSHYRATRTVYEKLCEFGYKRIGFVFSEQVNIKTQEHCLSAYLSETQRSQLKNPPPLVKDPSSAEEFFIWHKKHKPDAVIISTPWWQMIQSSETGIPKDLGFASPMVPIHNPELTGIIEKSRQIGSAAIDTLVHMIQHDSRGLPQNPRFILLEGEWNEGTTAWKQ